MKYRHILSGFFYFSSYCILCITSDNCSWTGPSTSSNLIYEIVIPNQYVIYSCAHNVTFVSGDAVLSSVCVGGAWSPLTSTCRSSLLPIPESNFIATNCNTPPSSPSSSSLFTIPNDNFTGFALLYQCNSGLSWLSGELFRISQCINGTWTVIHDICDNSSDIPRQCSDVYDMGLQTNGTYNVVPSGGNGPTVQVFCQVSGWTVILQKGSGFDIDGGSYQRASFENGTGTEAFDTLWAGTRILSQLSLDLNGNLRGMVLEIIMVYNSDKYYATYGNFCVGTAPDYRILSLGTYHGNAGDAMSPLVGSSFIFPSGMYDSGHPAWWGTRWYYHQTNSPEIAGANFLTTSDAFWGTLNAYTNPLTHVTMRIRSISSDAAVTCPPMVGSFPSWKTTFSDVSYNRFPRANFTWNCTGAYLFEGEEGKNRTTSGMAVCLQQPGQLPYWSYNVTLPCALVCPSGFQINYDGSTCFRPSSITAKDIVDAQQQCETVNATLGTVTNTVDAAIGDDDSAKYFVSYTDRPSSSGSRTAFLPSLPPTVNYPISCRGSCDNNGGNPKTNATQECTVLRNNGTYEYTYCYQPYKFFCELPVNCSVFNEGSTTFYGVANGGCYAVVRNSVTNGNIENLYETCRALGAGLAYPTTLDVMRNLSLATVQQFTQIGIPSSQTDVSFGIGYYYLNSSLSHGYYSMSEDIVHKPHFDASNDLLWQTVLVNRDGSFTFQALNSTMPVTLGICHYNGQLDCTGNPPLPSAGQSLNWNTNITYSTLATYTCTLGNFVNGNPILPITQTFKCMGQIGEWYSPSPYQPCLPIPVCSNSTLTVPDELIMVENPSSYFYNETLDFICPDGTGIADGNPEQTVNCIVNGTTLSSPTPTFSFVPSVLQSCTNCIGNVSVGNATTPWSDIESYTKNVSFIATCLSNYQYDYNITTQNVTCTNNGWYYKYSECYFACTSQPPVLPPNMTSNFANVCDLGTIVQYTCSPGLLFMTTQNFTIISNTVDITCNNGTWTNPRDSESFTCLEICSGDPPKAPANATYDWDGYSRAANDVVTYNCTSGHLLPTYTTNMAVTCNGSQWITYDSTPLICKQACTAPPAELLNATTNYNYSGAFLGQRANYTCLAGLGNQTNKATQFNIKCTAKGWTNVTNFQCQNVCLTDPPRPPTYATYNYVNKTKEGTKVTYYCPHGHFENETGIAMTTLQSTCSAGNWTLIPVPSCCKFD